MVCILFKHTSILLIETNNSAIRLTPCGKPTVIGPRKML